MCEDSGRIPSYWERENSSTWEIVYLVFRRNFPEDSPAGVRVVKDREGWVVAFFTKPEEYLKESKKRYNTKSEALLLGARNLMIGFNVGQKSVDDDYPVKADGTKGDMSRWSQLKLLRDEKLKRIKFGW